MVFDYQLVTIYTMAASRQLASEVIMVTFMSPFDAPRRGWDLWRFAALIPSGCRLPPSHKVMGDHASSGSIPAGAFTVTWQKREMKTEWKMVEGKVEKERERGEGGKEGVEVVKEDRVGYFVPAWADCRDGLWGNHDESGLLMELLG